MAFKKNRVSLFVFVLICLGILTILRLGWLYLFYPVNQANAVNGHVFINSEDIKQDELLYLMGEWKVDDKQILSTKNNIPLRTESAQATLKIKFDSPVNLNNCMLYIPSSPYKTTILVNGVKIGEAEEHYGKLYNGYSVPVTIKAESITLQIRAKGENVAFPFFGKNVMLSSQEGITDRMTLNNSIRVAIMITLLMNIIYSLVVYFFIYRTKLVLLYAAVFFFPFLDEFYQFSLSYIDWFQLSYNLEVKLTTIFNFCTAFCLILIGKMRLYPSNFAHIRVISGIYAIAFMVIFIVPVQWFGYYDMVLLALYIATVLYVYSRGLIKRKITDRGIFFLLFAFSAAVSGIFWGIIKAQLYFDIPFYPLDYLAIEFCLAGYWFYRYYMNNQKVKNLVEELQLADRMKEDFLQNSSERLYNPLNKLMMMLEEFTKAEKPEVYQENISKMKNVAQGMYFTLNDVLDYTRLKEGKIICEQKPVNIQAILYYIKDLFDHILPLNQMNIILEMPEQLPFVCGDEKRLGQVFFNLLQYSLSATYSGTIKIKCSVHGTRVMVEIVDASLYKKEMLQDVKKISLDVCRQLIELQGGQLKIDSESVVVELFASQYEYSVYSFPENHSQKVDKINVASILIFAERMQDLDMLQTVFSSEPYYIKIAKSNEEIKPLLLQKPWDLVIIDSIVSNSSGYRLIEFIRKQFTLVELPILYMAVEVNDFETSNCFTIGANDFITKPIQPLKLKNRVRALITTKQMVENQLQLETSLLQAQIEPHFLFNTLNSIASLSEIDTDKMVRLLIEFGEYLSSSINKRMMKRLVPLKDEMQVVKSYTYIEQQRFDPVLKVKWEIEDLFDISVPPFSLQTIVENAIRHGIQKNDDGGTVVIQIYKKENVIYVVVQDDGVGIEREKLDHLLDQSDQCGIGLVNTHERLKRCFGIGLHIESEVGKGTIVTMSIPLK